jgi:hypothetical protein
MAQEAINLADKGDFSEVNTPNKFHSHIYFIVCICCSNILQKLCLSSGKPYSENPEDPLYKARGSREERLRVKTTLMV